MDGTSALILTFSLEEKEKLLAVLVLRMSVLPIPSLEISKARRTFLPLLGGEGRGEGGCHCHF